MLFHDRNIMGIGQNRITSLLLCLLMFVGDRALGADAYLTLNPMLGHVSDTEARVWVKASGAAWLGIRVGEKADLSDARTIEGPGLVRDADYMGHVVVPGLRAETRYY